ncbi:MAG: cation:proton antiporter [Burkholderiales bacterium]|nr:cation:proton antiporter [Burkholderiales bacterium]
MSNPLELVLVLLASAVLVVVLARILHLPPMLGYLLVGVAIGPFALHWMPASEESGYAYLAEFGVVFLMFSIGLEFSLPKLFNMRRVVFGLGMGQVLLTVFAPTLLAWLVGFSWQVGFALGGALAMSSTAIVSKLLAERMQLESVHGREIIGVLLFQDLAVVPLLILIPALAQPAKDLAPVLALALVKAAVVLFVILFAGQKLMRGWFHIVARRRSHELFVLNVLLITLGLAWATELAGLSLALGAFLAGMLISETEYRHQVEEDIKPFRDLLLGLFFVTVGMQLDVSVVVDRFWLVLLLFAGPVLFKFALIAALSRMFGATPGNALRTALALAQAGEFGFVLLAQAGGAGLVDQTLLQPVLAAMLLSMLSAPFLIQYSDKLVLRFVASEWMLRSLQLHQIAVSGMAVAKHVVLCGYGRTGQNLARFLEQEGIGYVALDLDPERVREAAAAGETVVYGDAARREALIAAGLARASALVISFPDIPAALKILYHAHSINPALPVIVRTLDDADMERLQAAGAAEVVPDTFESSLMLASHALVLMGVPLKRVVRSVRAVRENRYSMLRGFFHGEGDAAADAAEHRLPRLHSVTLTQGAYAVGKTLAELDLTALSAAVTRVRRRGIRASEPAPETRFEEGDVVVVLGEPDALEAAEIRLLQGTK